MAIGGLTKIDELVPTEEEEAEEVVRHPFVFTSVVAEEAGVSPTYTAICGHHGRLDPGTQTITEVENRLYIISARPHQSHSRAYEGKADFCYEEGIYFALVWPDWTLLSGLDPATRWRFRYVSFEYPKKRKMGFILPTLNTFPFAWCFISSEEREWIEHLCPPEPVARYDPQRFGYKPEELASYLADSERQHQQSQRLYPIVEELFRRSGGDAGQYLPMGKELLPQEYRDYELLYDAQILGGW